MLGMQLQVGDRKHARRDRRFARGRHHEDMQRYILQVLLAIHICTMWVSKTVSRKVTESIKMMTGASSSSHVWYKFASWSVGSGFLSARSALAIVFGANLGAISGAKMVLIRLTGSPEKAPFLWFRISAAFKLVLPTEGGDHFYNKICNFEKTRVYTAVKIWRKS